MLDYTLLRRSFIVNVDTTNSMKDLSDSLNLIRPLENQGRELADSEKLEAARKLSALVDGLLLQFADAVEIDDYVDMRVAVLRLAIPLENDKRVSASVESYLYNDRSMRKQIFLVNASHHTTHQYHMEHHDEVLRYDQDTSIPGELAVILARIYALETIDGEELTKIMDGMNNISNNKKLERQLGVNDQPIGPDEIDKLARLLGSAGRIDAHE